jgi:hypothetical protein
MLERGWADVQPILGVADGRRRLRAVQRRSVDTLLPSVGYGSRSWKERTTTWGTRPVIPS